MSKIQTEQNLFNKMLITQAINYKKRGYSNIKINNEKCINGQPSKVCGYIPDLSAVLDDEVILCEVVTEDSINETGAFQKWKTLSQCSHSFHMIIPRKSFEMIKDLMKSNGVIVNKYWCS
jgi:hypothetical protein